MCRTGCKEGRKRIHCRSCHGQGKFMSDQIILMIDFSMIKGVRMGMTRMGPITFQQPVQCRDCDGEGNENLHFHRLSQRDFR